MNCPYKSHSRLSVFVWAALLLAMPLGFASAASYASNNQFLRAKSGADRKAATLVSQMTLEEKIGQMTQVDLGAIKDKNDITRLSLGSILGGGDSIPKDISPRGWANACDDLQSYALKTRLKVPLLYGIEAVHGHDQINGAVIFPHSIGLGATRNAQLVEHAARVTAKELAGTGINWDFAPGVMVARDERSGRTYESFGEDPELVSELAGAYVRGLQTARLVNPTSILACPKEFLGETGTQAGKDNVCDEAAVRRLFLPPYQAAIRAGAGSIMVSYSSWNGQKMLGHKHLLTDVLKGELHFRGFLVSDGAALAQLSADYKSGIETAINAGLDMIMVPNGPGTTNNYVEFIQLLKGLVQEGRVPESRVDDAVRRILRLKLEMGIFEHPYADHKLTVQVGSEKHREVARECVRKSLVLLKNEGGVLPLPIDADRLHVAGLAADDIGIQCGGWTMARQGGAGKVVEGGTTILQAIRQAVRPGVEVTFSADGSGAADADAVVVVLGEKPYAGTKGDQQELNLTREDLQLLKIAKASGAPVVLVLLAGRPIILGEALELCDAVVAAWLPGTEGQGVADVLLGKVKPTGKLPCSWPRAMSQIPINVGDATYDPLFKYGFGLSYSAK